MHTLVLKYRWVWFFILILQVASSCNKSNYKPSIVVFAHAGMSLYEERSIYPANTFEAIQYSVDVLNAEGVEVDIQMTKDSVLVLYHDSFITTAPGYSGCISSHNFKLIENLKHNNSTYSIVKLDTVLNYLVSKNVQVYLDLKPYNHCEKVDVSLTAFASQLDSLMNDYTIDEKELIITGSLNRNLLQNLKVPNKCFEGANINYVLSTANEVDCRYIMLPVNLIDDKVALRLVHSPYKWGVYGGKSNGEIRKTISFKPDCFISDNFVYTQKITK